VNTGHGGQSWGPRKSISHSTVFLWALLAGPHHRESEPVCSVAPVPLTVTLLETDMHRR